MWRWLEMLKFQSYDPLCTLSAVNAQGKNVMLLHRLYRRTQLTSHPCNGDPCGDGFIEQQSRTLWNFTLSASEMELLSDL